MQTVNFGDDHRLRRHSGRIIRRQATGDLLQMRDVEEAGGALVALSPDTAAFRKRAWHAHSLRFPVLNDADGAVSLQFGTLFRVPDGLRDFYLTAGIDLTLRHGDTSWFLPMPATFIAGSDGILRFTHASGDITERVEPADIISLMGTMID